MKPQNYNPDILLKSHLRPIFEQACTLGDITFDELLSRRRTINIARVRFIIWKALRCRGWSYTDISNLFNYDHATIISGIHSLENDCFCNTRVKKFTEHISNQLSEFQWQDQ